MASWLLPKRLRQHFANVYAFCRWADNIADEYESSEASLMLLDWCAKGLDSCFEGRAGHPVFVALQETVRQFEIPRQPFDDLLAAFRQDQTVSRYENFDDLLAYCRHSANPVGRLVLYLGECHTAENVALSDGVCTGLQLANFWQDVARDFQAGRVYLPAQTMRQFDMTEADLASAPASDRLRAAIRYEVDRAERYLAAGWPLVAKVSPELRVDVSLFIRGGLEVLRLIRRQDYDVLTRRPKVSKLTKMRLLYNAWRKPTPDPLPDP